MSVQVELSRFQYGVGLKVTADISSDSVAVRATDLAGAMSVFEELCKTYPLKGDGQRKVNESQDPEGRRKQRFAIAAAYRKREAEAAQNRKVSEGLNRE